MHQYFELNTDSFKKDQHSIGLTPPGSGEGRPVGTPLGRAGPGRAEISEADAHIFRLVRQALVGREAAPWAFYVVGPDGIRDVTVGP
jgi:hypothetical protein